MSNQRITLGGGCFWCLDSIFRQLNGVSSVTSGYQGGERSNPSYEQICSGATGHAEVVRVEFDDAVISLTTILEVFFTVHDPTTLNRQGADVGSQYRSIIFYQTPQQQQLAEQMMADLEQQGRWPDSIVTELQQDKDFYSAEDYHQDYFEQNPGNRYCQLVVAPKIAKFFKQRRDLLKG
ncbi:Peptide methionine sulfoxide reductase MsrA 2 [Sinobacterium norvegicum]|uniref:Peptide methionine sulfoxide reductase MsrA n=1 Tax=Sinobacterium norvegicum TaxID=1641715 RepID=A0ABM9ACE3_9GAMM|nr:peptide-methionine (S)-S-oxide reductase MsrA [Sinobacterium norvegicum]CAH0990877.1 Peptide methionine sulfoxide reductase MsrA 2 [Sinobacterium norvegicum]